MVKKGNIVEPAGTSTQTTDHMPARSQKASLRIEEGGPEAAILSGVPVLIAEMLM
jgi:hypothetical protein